MRRIKTMGSARCLFADHSAGIGSASAAPEYFGINLYEKIRSVVQRAHLRDGHVLNHRTHSVRHGENQSRK